MMCPSTSIFWSSLVPIMDDPHKIGNLMWARTESGLMIPYDLHERVSDRDASNLNRVYESLRAYRKIVPTLYLIRELQWANLELIKPYLIESMKGRSEARSMRTTGDWERYWSSLN